MTMIRASRPNAYTGSPLDRAAERRNDAAWIEAARQAPEVIIAPVWRARNLLRGVEARAPEAVFLDGPHAAAMLARADHWAFLGLRDGVPVFAVDISTEDNTAPLMPDETAGFADLRATMGLLNGQDASVLAHARGLMHWRTKHKFCGICGSVCEPTSAGHVMHCTGCGVDHFPRTDPAVIMLVSHGDRALLGHSARFPTSTMYSTLAGFVEPGESLEEAVAREVFEESGIRITNVRYHSSQPWPFPASIMLGFYADALTEEITIDPEELTDARWFTRAQMHNPRDHGFQLPRGDSVASRLIEDWLNAE